LNLDPYPTLKKSLIALRGYVGQFDKEEVTTDKHDLWSTKKLIALRYYIYPYLQIMRKYKFKKLHYVDLFAGSGLLRIKGKVMPGTSLIPLLRTKELYEKNKAYFFDEYHLSDINQKYVDVLKSRILKLKEGLPTKITIKKGDFASVSSEIFTGKYPEFGKQKEDGYLVVLDPYGFSIEWNQLERILKSGAVDVLITFHTSNVSWNQNKEQSKNALTKMFGGGEWVDCSNTDDFMELYCKKIRKIPTQWKPFNTKTLTVSTSKGRYHLICASRSPGAQNLFKAMQDKFDEVSNELLEDVFNVAIGKNTDMDTFFEKVN
jgi:three-Cys-motif partner protein